MEPVIFDSSTLRIVCISDTHNDNPTQHIPHGDLIIHAGDLTDDGSVEELQAAYQWFSTLPHKVKVVVAGNHDLGLDEAHQKFDHQNLELFTSEKAKAAGIHYLFKEVRTVAHCRAPDGGTMPVQIYGNPYQPDFLKSSYAFTYLPEPSEGSEQAWANAPTQHDSVDIWAMHSPPKDRLDAIPVPPLTGCAVQARKIAQARPLLCVFGHYHSSWGLERVRWQASCDEVAEAQILSSLDGPQDFDFSNKDALKRGKDTVFVNAAWMTMQKRAVLRRNPPFVVNLALSSSSETKRA